MRKGGAKAKGSSFENKTAKQILKAAGNQFTRTDCYRTPISGGHPFASKNHPSDLVLSKKLRKVFPFSVECKHYKKLELQHFFTRQGDFLKWIDQAMKATENSRVAVEPMIVFRWNLSRTYCIVPWITHSGTYIRFRYRGKEWKVVLFASFLRQWFDK